MSAVNNPENARLGPLPKAKRSDELEQLGLDALRAALPVGKFLFRDERVDDKGVDGTLELKIENQFTNLRSQVQLKSTESIQKNQDGSFSWCIDTSNLNYLLNGHSPIYVLYIVPRKELRYIWAHDELQRIAAQNPRWREQQTVTLRFHLVLSSEEINKLHDRIRREALCHRQIHEILGRTTLSEDVSIAIHPSSFEVTDPDVLYQFLSESGMAAVCSGYSRQVLDRTRLLSTERRNEPRLRLVSAYAEHTMGKYFAALSHLVEIVAQDSQLPEYDRYFMESLHDACLFQIGKISRNEYERRDASRAEKASGILLLQHQLNVIRKQFYQECNQTKRRSILEALQIVVHDIMAREEVNKPFTLHARIELLRAQGSCLIDDFSFTATAKGLRGDLGMRFDTPESIARAKDVLGRKIEWVEAGNRIIEDAAELEHPMVLGDALLTSTSVIIAMLSQRRIIAGDSDIPNEMQARLVEHVEKAIEMFAHCGTLERELRARMLRADLHDFFGEADEASRIAREVLPQAEALEYASIVKDAKSHLTGTSTWQKVEARTKALLQNDPDFDIAQQTNEDLSRFAKYLHAALQLPNERMQMVERELACMRAGARERLSWCRHLSIRGEDESFATEPERRCFCLLHNTYSEKEDSVWDSVIQTFKQEQCVGCRDRDPKTT